MKRDPVRKRGPQSNQPIVILVETTLLLCSIVGWSSDKY